MQTNESVRVVFRVSKDDKYDVYALFPDLPATPTLCTSYEHNGQHGSADYVGCVRGSRPASPDEYAALARELTRIGYSLDIRKRR